MMNHRSRDAIFFQTNLHGTSNHKWFTSQGWIECTNTVQYTIVRLISLPKTVWCFHNKHTCPGVAWSIFRFLLYFLVLNFNMNSIRLGAKSVRRQIPPIRMKQVLLLLGCIHWSVFVVPMSIWDHASTFIPTPALVNDWVVRWLCFPPKHRPNSTWNPKKNQKTKANFWF